MKLFRLTGKTNIIILSIIVFALALINDIFSQSPERYLQINGTAELNMKPVYNAIITLYEGNTKVNIIKTGSNGIFSFKLDMNKDYIVEVSKEGYVQKRIRFITKIPDEETGIWVREFAVTLVKYCEGVNYSVLDEPVDVIKYSLNRKDFDSDKTFVYKMKPRLENLAIDIDQCLTKDYNNILDDADKLLDDKKYDDARNKYEQALEMFPDQKYPVDQITKINDLTGKEKSIDDLYRNTINEADALYAQKRYDEALLKYKGALTLKPQETYLKQRINEIETLIAKSVAEQQAKSETDTKYNSLILKGNSAFAEKNYEMAKQLYSQALELKPDNYYPSDKLKEIDALIAQKTQTEAKQQEITKEYNNSVSQADRLLLTKNYEEAKAFYNKALLMEPLELYPREKIAEIENIIRNKQEAEAKTKSDAINKEYQATLMEGDSYFKLKEYEAAKIAYSKASSIKPNEFYPKQQIDRINNLIATEQASKQQAVEKGYNNAISAGENYMAIKQYDQAKQEFNKALTYKSDDFYAKNKISEIDRLLDIQKQRLAEENYKKEQYQAAVTRADGFFQKKEYDAAKTAYQDALNINPAEQYPRLKIQEIDRILAMEQASKQREIEDRYKSAIITGNSYFTNNQYTLAKKEFENALTYKPGDVYAMNRISEINRLIMQEEQRLAATQSRKKQYDGLIAKADGLMNLKDYINAKIEYNKALQVLPEEIYPQQQIAEIDRIIKEQERTLAEKKAKENSYALTISKADGYLRLQEYEKAKVEYNYALTIMPNEIYPKNKIIEIDKLIQAQLKALADTKAKSDAYNKAIVLADNLFNQNKFEEAKSGYYNALNYNSDANYPKEQISKIDNILAQQERMRQTEAAKEKEYSSLISIADKAFDAADYNNAKDYYQKALAVKPDEIYPKQKISRIDEILKLLAKQNTPVKSSQTQTQSQMSPITDAKPKLADLIFKDDSERDKYLNELKKKYPEGITLETYVEKFKTTKRYVIIRKGEAHEFRMVHFTSWGGKEYSVDGKPITGQYFESQIAPRSGEYYKEFEF